MFGLSVQIVDRLQSVAQATFRSLGHAAAAIRKTAIGSIGVSDEPSAPGSPPHTRGRQLPRAIVYDVSAESAVVGPRESVVGQAGAAHEHGGEFRGDQYAERPFMAPALVSNLERFPQEWEGAIGE
jgi:hypothetical protein